jgi:hypothetical protein
MSLESFDTDYVPPPPPPRRDYDAERRQWEKVILRDAVILDEKIFDKDELSQAADSVKLVTPSPGGGFADASYYVLEIKNERLKQERQLDLSFSTLGEGDKELIYFKGAKLLDSPVRKGRDSKRPDKCQAVAEKFNALLAANEGFKLTKSEVTPKNMGSDPPTTTFSYQFELEGKGRLGIALERKDCGFVSFLKQRY